MSTASTTSASASRKPLPDRRRAYTQKVRIDGHTFYLACGEYEDGALGEVWLEASKEGTFLRGVVGALARTVSVALQCGADFGCVVAAMRGVSFPPNGAVTGSEAVSECTSVVDWVAQELEARYGRPS